MVPGEILPATAPVVSNVGRSRVRVRIENTGDRPIQVGSHYHIAEANPALAFDRALAWGHRLAIPAGTSVRFEPGIARDVELVPLGGARVVAGLRGAAGGPLDPPAGAGTAGSGQALDSPSGADLPRPGAERR
jgi:urease subunit beta